jgi:stress response protein YsnF
MALVKIKDFEPDYREAFGGYDIKGLDVYSDVNNEKVGTVHDLLVDEQGHFRYFIVDLGFWGFGKKVMLPVERAQIDSDGKHLYALGLHKDQVEQLAEFNESLRIDDDRRQELHESLRQPVHQPVADSRSIRSQSTAETLPPQSINPTYQVMPIERTAPLERSSYPSTAPQSMPRPDYSVSNQGVYEMQRDYPSAPNYHSNLTSGHIDQSPSVLQRFEERLRAKRMQSR